MSKYRIYYTETTTNEIDIEADTAQEAINILTKQHLHKRALCG